MDAKQVVIGLSGRTRSGKSTIAAALVERLGWPNASFGDFVRAEAATRGIGEEREGLQELGEALIAELGWPEFCTRTLRHSGLDGSSVPCIVDGVRHVDALTTLRRVFQPVPVLLVHLEVPDELRDARLAVDGISEVQGRKWEEHSTERDVAKLLPEMADLKLPASGDDPSATVDAIETWLGSVATTDLR
jgi:adenylate kinase family enzyme